MPRPKVKSRSHRDVADLLPSTNVPYQVPTSNTLRLPRYSPDNILQVKVTMVRSKVKSRSRHDAAHLQPLTNVLAEYQLPTPYSFQDITRTIFYMSRSLWQGQISLPSINFLHLLVSEIQPGQTFATTSPSAHPPNPARHHV